MISFVSLFKEHLIPLKATLVPIAFTFLYMLAMLRPVIPVFDYVINQDYIAEYLCINKDKPEMHCDGKCYLMEMLDEQNQQKKQNLPAIDLREYPIGFVQVLNLSAREELSLNPTTVITYIEQYSYLFNNSLFRPPSNC